MPPADAPLRQGDLLAEIEFSSRDAEKPPVSSYAVVLDNCCTIEQQHTVLVARVSRRSKPTPGSSTEESLAAIDSLPGKPYAPYEHQLDAVDGHVNSGAKIPVVRLLERNLYAAPTAEGLAWLSAKRVARMTVVGRVQFRRKVALHFGRTVEEDSVWLAQHGLDELGRPQP